jgi:phospholipase C
MRRGFVTSVCLVMAGLAIIAGPSTGGAAVPFNKINHFVVMMQENRSFDHYFGHLKAYDPTLNVEPEPTTGNVGPNGRLIKPFHEEHYCAIADLDHSWNGTHREWNGGAMDGFATANAVTADPNGRRAMGYYTAADLPYYYDLLDHFAFSDTYFSSVLDQTFPNRFYLLSGTSFGHIRNDFPIPPGANVLTDYSQPTIFNRLDAKHISWRIYFNEVPFAFLYGYVRTHALGHVFPITQYFIDAAAGTLPQVSFVDPIFLASVNTENDEHPPSNVQNGQKLVETVVGALFRSPNWKDSAFILTYDEHGGYYDHLPPPKAPLPDGIAPMLQPGDVPGVFDQLGIRVPVVVVSPWSKKHYVSTALPLQQGGANPAYANPAHIYSHTSILATLEARFSLAPLTARDASSNTLADFFNFSVKHFATPPALKPAKIDLQEFLFCELHREHLPTGF